LEINYRFGSGDTCCYHYSRCAPLFWRLVVRGGQRRLPNNKRPPKQCRRCGGERREYEPSYYCRRCNGGGWRSSNLALTWLAGALIGWLGLGWHLAAALGAVVGCSILGAVSREIVLGVEEGLRAALNGVGQGLAYLFRRVLPIFIGGTAVFAIILVCPRLAEELAVLAVVCLGLWVMVRPLFTSGRRRSK